MRFKRAGVVFSMVMLALVLVATLTPTNGATVTSEFWCIACGEAGGLDVLNDIVMFVPLGFAFAMATVSPDTEHPGLRRRHAVRRIDASPCGNRA